MIKIKTIIFVVFFALLNTYAYSYTIIATETARGEYENSKFIKHNNGEFKYRIEIDEEKGIAQITEYTRLKDNSIVDWKASYVISYVDDGNSLSGSILADKNKANQKMICLVGNPGTLATEIILIGETFFEYAKASSGRLYMASGTIQKVISDTKDIENQFKK
ncbi:MAG: hypothetical protein V1933_01790 [Candidatus Omnitrophota bacterium]